MADFRVIANHPDRPRGTIVSVRESGAPRGRKEGAPWCVWVEVPELTNAAALRSMMRPWQVEPQITVEAASGRNTDLKLRNAVERLASPESRLSAASVTEVLAAVSASRVQDEPDGTVSFRVNGWDADKEDIVRSKLERAIEWRRYRIREAVIASAELVGSVILTAEQFNTALIDRASASR